MVLKWTLEELASTCLTRVARVSRRGCDFQEVSLWETRQTRRSWTRRLLRLRVLSSAFVNFRLYAYFSSSRRGGVRHNIDV